VLNEALHVTGPALRFFEMPRTPVAALGTEAAAGLLASWTCNLFLAPMFSTELGGIQLYPFRAVPNEQGSPLAACFAAIVAGAVVLTVIVYVGVIRRWQSAIRIAGYIIAGLVLWLYRSYGTG